MWRWNADEKDVARRQRVTAEEFGVAESLLGQRLAAPWRRGLALLVDLLMIFVLTQTGSLGFSLAVGIAVFLLAMRGAIGRSWGCWLRGALAATVAFLCFATVLSFLNYEEFMAGSGGPGMKQWAEFGSKMGSSDPEVQRQAIEELNVSFEAATTDVEIAEWAEAMYMPGGMGWWLQDDDVVEPEPADPEALRAAVSNYAAALEGEDAAAIDSAASRLRELLAGAELESYRHRMSERKKGMLQLVQENGQLRQQLDEPSFLRSIQGVATDLGLTVGWSTVYFTLFPAFWGGRTPGKRLLRIRIQRLDLRNLGVWSSFERFAGYTAGLATGLLGFLQLFWDPNRQALQDKIVGTVVVSDETGQA